MLFIEQNIRGLCDQLGMDYQSFLEDMEVDNAKELSLSDLEAIAEEYKLDLYSFLFSYSKKSNDIKDKLAKIKLLVLDVDGVLTDGGMYFTEEGDQFKKFNTKDGMAIIHLTKSDFQVAIISSGFKGDLVKKRADMLGIQFCHVGREPKISVLSSHCAKLGIQMSEVAIIGDDINDLEVMNSVGLSICPVDAVGIVKANCEIILNSAGGTGCVREFIDHYLLENPLN
jgi:YrbI family 3-deoxy-D-manno-octulosonate 8-phosphate phosphatase